MVPGRRNKKHVPTSECSSTAESTTGKGFATFLFVLIITGPNENSQKASISVYVLAANSQDEDYEGTTRPRPESDKQTRKLDDEMNDIETEEKKYHPSILEARVKPIQNVVSECPTAKRA